jgi:hypothetical protein
MRGNMHMMLPLNILDLSLLFGATSIILLVTSEMLSTYLEKINILINRKKLRNASMIFAFLCLTTVAIIMVTILLNS